MKKSRGKSKNVIKTNHISMTNNNTIMMAVFFDSYHEIINIRKQSINCLTHFLYVTITQLAHQLHKIQSVHRAKVPIESIAGYAQNNKK
jgi:hypothetical protein